MFSILSYLSAHFYTYNVEILLKRTGLGIHPGDKSLKGFSTWPVGIALPRR